MHKLSQKPTPAQMKAAKSVYDMNYARMDALDHDSDMYKVFKKMMTMKPKDMQTQMRAFFKKGGVFDKYAYKGKIYRGGFYRLYDDYMGKMQAKFPKWPTYNKRELAKTYDAYDSFSAVKGITKRDYKKIYKIMMRLANGPTPAQMKALKSVYDLNDSKMQALDHNSATYKTYISMKEMKPSMVRKTM